MSAPIAAVRVPPQSPVMADSQRPFAQPSRWASPSAYREIRLPFLFARRFLLVQGAGVRLRWVIALVTWLQMDEILPDLATRADVGTCRSD